MAGQSIKSEFAAVEVGVDEQANGPRLRIEDLKTGHVGYLDALELETLAWLPEGALHPLLDPSALRFTEEHAQPSITALVKQVYAALAQGDRGRLLELLAADFAADFAPGMPAVAIRPIRSAEEMIDNAWWPLGRAFGSASRRRNGSRVGRSAAGRGAIRGQRAVDGARPQAKLVHLWTARGGTLTHLSHLTDTAAWAAALEP